MLVKNKKLFLAQIIGGAVGGAYLGLMKVVTNAFVFGSVTTFPAFIVNNANVIHGAIGLLIATRICVYKQRRQTRIVLFYKLWKICYPYKQEAGVFKI